MGREASLTKAATKGPNSRRHQENFNSLAACSNDGRHIDHPLPPATAQHRYPHSPIRNGNHTQPVVSINQKRARGYQRICMMIPPQIHRRR